MNLLGFEHQVSPGRLTWPSPSGAGSFRPGCRSRHIPSIHPFVSICIWSRGKPNSPRSPPAQPSRTLPSLALPPNIMVKPKSDIPPASSPATHSREKPSPPLLHTPPPHVGEETSKSHDLHVISPHAEPQRPSKKSGQPGLELAAPHIYILPPPFPAQSKLVR
jgi:hypothetical protein